MGALQWEPGGMAPLFGALKIHKALEMEHLSLYGGSVRGTWKEGLYNENSKRCVIQGSRNGAFVFIWVPQWEPIGT